jgi:hypothetical protein
MNHQPMGMPELFSQLGLENSYADIAQFIQHHPLPPETHLADASFWTPAQRAFLRESWHQDSDWCELVDQLNQMLRKTPFKH